MPIKICAFGDIHGINIGGTIVEKVNELIKQDPKQIIVFLGDYIDRGGHERDILMALNYLRCKYDNCIFLLGNHEGWMIDALYSLNYININPEKNFPILSDINHPVNKWLKNGGFSTVLSLAKYDPLKGPKCLEDCKILADSFCREFVKFRQFFQLLVGKLSISDDISNTHYRFTHAGPNIKKQYKNGETGEYTIVQKKANNRRPNNRVLMSNAPSEMWEEVNTKYLAYRRTKPGHARDYTKINVFGHTITPIQTIKHRINSDGLYPLDAGSFNTGKIAKLNIVIGSESERKRELEIIGNRDLIKEKWADKKDKKIEIATSILSCINSSFNDSLTATEEIFKRKIRIEIVPVPRAQGKAYVGLDARSFHFSNPRIPFIINY